MASTARCAYCGGEVNLQGPLVCKEVTGWVGGAKKDSMRLRSDTGRYAHNSCVQLAVQGMPPSQPDLFDEGGYEEMLAQQREIPDLPLEEI